MARKLSAAELFDTLEVDLWGNGYTLRQVTRTVLQRLQDAQKQVQKLHDESDDDVDGDEVAAAVIGVIDVLLAPANDGDAPAADVLRKRWDADELGMDWLNTLMAALNEEAQVRARPTSAATSGD